MEVGTQPKHQPPSTIDLSTSVNHQAPFHIYIRCGGVQQHEKKIIIWTKLKKNKTVRQYMQHNIYLYIKTPEKLHACISTHAYTYTYTQKHVSKDTDALKVFRAKWKLDWNLEIKLSCYSMLPN